jgi:hypothetical protein
MLIVLAIICFILAVAIGSWRQMCDVYQLHMPFNCPPIWNNAFVRIFTWILSAMFSLIFATIFAMWISEEVNDWFGKFTFGVFLTIRWLTSGFFGSYPAIKRCNEFKNTYASDNVNYDELANSMIKTRRQNNESEISKDEIIAQLKVSAHKISTNTLDEDEQKALEHFRNLEKK